MTIKIDEEALSRVLFFGDGDLLRRPPGGVMRVPEKLQRGLQLLVRHENRRSEQELRLRIEGRAWASLLQSLGVTYRWALTRTDRCGILQSLPRRSDGRRWEDILSSGSWEIQAGADLSAFAGLRVAQLPRAYWYPRQSRLHEGTFPLYMSDFWRARILQEVAARGNGAVREALGIVLFAYGGPDGVRGVGMAPFRAMMALAGYNLPGRIE